MKRRAAVVALACLGAALTGPVAVRAQPAARGYLARDDVQEFIDAMAAGYGLEPGWLRAILNQARYSETAERLTTPGMLPPSSRNWVEYRARAVEARRVREGLAFWREHRETLARATAEFGVPEEIVVAIIGIETLFGRLTGRYRTLDVLMTLSFDYTRRAAYYRSELAQFLLLCREQRLDPLALRGSFAGALGLPQFMPSSARSKAIDFDGDGRIDLTSPGDAIGSVARFLALHDWHRETPVAFTARADAATFAALDSGIQARHRWEDVQARGVTIDGSLEPATAVLLADLPFVTAAGEEGTEFRVGTVNFAALLNYNRSYFYAAAVTELAQVLRARRQV